MFGEHSFTIRDRDTHMLIGTMADRPRIGRRIRVGNQDYDVAALDGPVDASGEVASGVVSVVPVPDSDPALRKDGSL